MAIEWRGISTLIPYARNARSHSDAQIAEISGSIREFGFTNPVLIDPEGRIFGQFTSLPDLFAVGSKARAATGPSSTASTPASISSPRNGISRPAAKRRTKPADIG